MERSQLSESVFHEPLVELASAQVLHKRGQVRSTHPAIDSLLVEAARLEPETVSRVDDTTAYSRFSRAYSRFSRAYSRFSRA